MTELAKIFSVKAPKTRFLIMKHGLLFLLLAVACVRASEEIPERFGSRLEEVSYPFPVEVFGFENVSVVGHSMGGMLATRFALMFPDRVEKLALIDPIGLEDWKRVVPYRTISEWYSNELKVTPDQQKRYQMESYYHREWKPEYDRWVRLATGWLSSPDYSVVAWNSALTYDMIFTQPVCYEFVDLKMPTLLIAGSLDRTTIGKQWAPENVRETLGDYPKLAKSAASGIPECQLEILEGVGHVPQIEAPDLLFPILLNFLQD